MITEYKLEDAGREMLITIKRSSRKTLGLEVRENGEIFARIPEKLSDRSLKSFIEKERDWIIKKSELVKWEREHRQTTNATPVQELTSEEIDPFVVFYLCIVIFLHTSRFKVNRCHHRQRT